MALTALAVLTPNVLAHNGDKYTNTPFVVAASCTPGPGTANYVSQNGTLGILVTNGDFSTGRTDGLPKLQNFTGTESAKGYTFCSELGGVCGGLRFKSPEDWYKFANSHYLLVQFKVAAQNPAL